MIEDKNEDKYEKPDVTQIVHALIIYGLVVFLGFCLLIGLANKKQPNQDNLTMNWTTSCADWESRIIAGEIGEIIELGNIMYRLGAPRYGARIPDKHAAAFPGGGGSRAFRIQGIAACGRAGPPDVG